MVNEAEHVPSDAFVENFADFPDDVHAEVPTSAVRDLFGLAFHDICEFVRMLQDEGEVRGLIGPREVPRLWSRHIVNSAAILDFLPKKGQVLDIGSGAGFPGIVAAIARPHLDFHLAEPMQRRCEWLEDVIDTLGLDNVTIHQARAEELRGKGKADVVTARAVANMSKLVRMTSKLIAPGGHLVALKGRKAPIEVEDARAELRRHHLSAQIHEVPSVMEDEATYVVVCRRV
ncbi:MULTISPECIES: 16S rRNA (guanine(527)-N(7))-methyltransferase RsmG [unclassified Schaalia]|uniref:16S rRNA (guanine(527)-N(7))-methyltransferase RsmG n=1 Tax=unclassified Schaalia TaxID=2691889 RepID=UPI001E64A5DC|nr:MULTISPECIES: 16S rRNA (guanine(527)-N(7))-methyltransferase RsmG [unclassified Schaalia]MCD4550093.1 16S rRNA (guanine(527)-N(7))-methyltransferase RsmG [Schaalia sp. lx-260]MCD4557840.1 16S rRNA (guanine(527)-N(7))-methyltransferase RsmG [Schaalia sp. lx-100]